MITQNVAPVTISFTNTSSGDELLYLWNFGDGQTSTLANPTHTFQAGVWEVTLTVTNDNGQDQTSAVIVATEIPASGGGNGSQNGSQNGNQNGGNQNGGNQNDKGPVF